MAICLGIGRALGFLRDTLVMNFFGTTYEADIAVLILTTQDLLLNFFLGSAFSIALMPDFVAKNNNFGRTAYEYHKKLTPFLIAAITLLILNIDFVVHFLAPGMPSEYQQQLARYLPISFLCIPFTVYASITGAALNSFGVFALPSFGGAIFNFTVCSFLIFAFTFANVNPFYSIAVGVVFGSILRWLVQFRSLPLKKPLLPHQKTKINFKGFRQLYLSALLSSSCIFIIPIIARIFASKQGVGQIAIFSFVSKLIDFPISFFSGIVITILIPRLIKTKNNWKTIHYSTSLLLLFFSVVLLLIYFFSDVIVSLLLAFGKVSNENVVEISKQLKNASLMLPSYGVTCFLIAALATTKYAKFYGILCLTLNVIFYFLGPFYIEKISDIYTALICIYSTLGLVGFGLTIFQFKNCPQRKNVIQC